jgi:LuxR family maltose regulon positive regulatory protein
VQVVRPRLHTVLDGHGGAAVTQVCAPAGFGKTFLLSSWIHARADERVAWLSLEPGDDVRRLWSFVYASLGLPDAVEPLPVAPVAQRLSRLPEPMLVILDDFHHCDDPASLDAVEFLVRHSADRLRLILLTRVSPALPLVRWRLAGELADIGPGELAFTADETAELLAAHGHHLPDSMVSDLHVWSEGWPAVLGLAVRAIGTSLRTVDVDGIVAAAVPGIREYLRRELMNELPAGLRDVLLTTSILDRLYPDLVAATTDRRDGERVLVELERRNLFAETVATHPPSYRYHRVLSSLTRGELVQARPDKVHALHRRAAEWHRGVGLVGDALRHALAGRDYAYAVRLVAEEWPGLVLCPQSAAWRCGAPCVPDEALAADPALDLAGVTAHIARGDTTAAARHLARAKAHANAAVQTHVSAENDDHRDGLVAATVALDIALARQVGDVDTVRSAAGRMLDLVRDDRVGGAPRDVVGAVTTTALGMALLGAGELDEAETVLAQSIAATDRLGLTCPRAVCASGLAFLYAVQGELRAAERMARAALAVAACPGQSARLHCGYAYAALAMLAIEWDCLEEAEANLRLAAETCEPPTDPNLCATVAVVHAQLLHERGDLMQAREILLSGRRRGMARAAAYLRDWHAAVDVAVRAAHGDPETVRRSLDLAPESADPAPAALAVALARAYLAGDDLASACRFLPCGGDTLPRALRLEAGLIEAVAAHRRGDQRAATRLLERVLEDAEPDGFRRVFVRAGPAARDLLVGHLDSGTAYWTTVNALIAAIDDHATGQPATAALPEALTDREVTVLRYLQSVLSNAEIASDMCVSVNTVKTHVRNIYRKLDTTRRRDAVRRARQLHLL